MQTIEIPDDEEIKSITVRKLYGVELGFIDRQDLITVMIIHELFLVTITLAVLKVMGHVDWEWWEVLAPLWIPFAVSLVVAFAKAFVDAMRKSA